jgi:anti-sigma B factor antagonist
MPKENGFMEGIQVSVEKAGPQSDISIIRVGGYIDTTTSSELERALDSLLKAGVFRIIVDLGNVDYISSAGWGIFISEIKGIRERSGDLKLAKMIPDVFEVFELLEFHYILKAFDTIEEALYNFDEDRGISLEEPPAASKAEEEAGNGSESEAEGEEISEDTESKIKEIVHQNPSWGSVKIMKELNTEKYGFLRMNKISVWKILRKLNLDKKET